MKQITVVTTFNKAGLELYGQRFLDSFSARVDKKIKLLVYAEDCVPNNPDSEQITVLDPNTVLPKLVEFKKKWRDIPKANGKCPWPEKRPRDYHKEFKWDAVRFSNKIYAVLDACLRSQDWCVWMDGDTFVHSDWKYEDFASLLPSKKWITFVGRGKGSATWPECGFYGLNLNDKVCIEFLQELERYYEDADNGIFTLAEWHDSFVFGKILNAFRIKHPNIHDYTEHFTMTTAKSGGGGHPLINTELGKWIDHLKGARKRLGKSKKSDIKIPRSELYWRD
jgi:hypothetical protein